MIESQEVIEAVSKQPIGGDFDVWQYVVGGVGIIVTTLAGLVGMFYRSIETRNAADIASLRAMVEKLTKENEDVKRSQATMMIENAVLKKENETLRQEIRSLEDRINRYEQGSHHNP